MKFKSELTNRIIDTMDQCFYCQKIGSCKYSQASGYPYICADFIEDTERQVYGPGITTEEKPKMKFRILRDYDEFLPQVYTKSLDGTSYWEEIGKYHCHTIEEAQKVCKDYKRMKDDPIVEEFEL